ncbi:hypothetical protein WJX72_000976 [[Myrmecia] bisecta]|uniref:Uncharacterized protein n=1 Tax=[Myrmecia] bisecta TaxID=41462 RepID=A0AAW1Q9F3_9CHLO
MSKGFTNKLLAGSLVSLVVLGGLFPVWLAKGGAKKTDQSKALPAQSAIRGAYTNVGSRDIGPDPTYDARKG